jgi:hypothetical protein
LIETFSIQMNDHPRPVSKHRPHYFTPKVKFTAEEDELLREIVERCGPTDWRGISNRLGTRNPRQCRERWLNYLDPHVSSPNEWLPEEDARLESAFEMVGTHWNALASYFPGRSTNNVKNRFTLLQRRKKGHHPHAQSLPRAANPDDHAWCLADGEGQSAVDGGQNRTGFPRSLDDIVKTRFGEESETFNWLI